MPTLSGDVALTNATIPILSIYRAANAPAAAPAVAGSGPAFDLGFDLVARDGKDVRVPLPQHRHRHDRHARVTGSLAHRGSREC